MPLHPGYYNGFTLLVYGPCHRFRLENPDVYNLLMLYFRNKRGKDFMRV